MYIVIKESDRYLIIKEKKIGEEKRRHKRYSISKIDGLYLIINDKIEVEPLNISISGIAFQCDSEQQEIDISKDEIISLHIQYTDENIDAKFMGKIVWGFFNSVGAIFIDITQEEIEIIKEIIKHSDEC